MRKKLAFCLLMILIVPLCCIFTACKKGEKLNYDKISTNINQFASVGIGYYGDTSISLANEPTPTAQFSIFNYEQDINAMSSHAGRTNGRLIGIDEDGDMTPIKYKKDGEDVDIFKYLVACNQTERYMFLKYSSYNTGYEVDKCCLQYNGEMKYILDKTTGNMYRIDINFNLLLSYFGISASDCGDYIIIQSDKSYYKVGVEQDNLVFREILRTDSLPNYCEILLADIYGNCIVQSNYQYYLLNNQGTLSVQSLKVPSGVTILDNTYTIKAQNGIIYHNGHEFNAEGELVESEYIPDLTVLPKEYLIYSDATGDYYYSKLDWNGSTGVYYPYINKIMKVVQDGENIQITEIPLNFGGALYDNIYINAPNIYTITNNNVISKISIFTGEKTDIVIDDVLIRSIEPIGMGKVIFDAVNLQLQNISGMIDEFGNITYSVQEPDFKVFFYAPINKEN